MFTSCILVLHLLLPPLLHAGRVQLTHNGQPAAVGNYSKTASTTLSFDNGLILFTLIAGDPGVNVSLFRPYGIDANIASTTEATWYQDWSGGSGSNKAGVDTIRILRVADDLAEVALADTRHPARRMEQHIIMTSTMAGLYTFATMTIVSAAEDLNEIRHISRYDRCLLNYAFNHERPQGQQPTYAYLDTMPKIQDETWRVNGRPNPALPCPKDNDGNADGQLPDGTIYTKYMWSLYHAENPFWGHFGVVQNKLVGIWFTPLGGVSNQTSAATYGVGPQHQDLALHQDGILLNYMDPNHYGLPSYHVTRGYTRFYGPYLHHTTVYDDATDPKGFFATASAVASAAIASSIPALAIVSHPWYAPASARANVTGCIKIADGRPADRLWALVSTQDTAQSVYVIHEPTYYVLTGADGCFSIPGVPPGQFVLYVYAAAGTVTDTLVHRNVVVTGTSPVVDLGTLVWTPDDNGLTLLFQVGQADRTGSEFALAREPRSWDLPGRVPGTLNFTIGQSYEPHDWYYAQTQGGTWSITFNVPQAVPAGTARLTVAASLTDGASPTATINGHAIPGSLPQGSDSTLSRQAVRSGYARVAVLTFPTNRLVVGTNVLAFSRPSAGRGNNNTGMGWDIVKLQVAASALGGRNHEARLGVHSAVVADGNGVVVVRLQVLNQGTAPVMCARLEAVTMAGHGSQPLVFADGRDPAIFPVPVGTIASNDVGLLDLKLSQPDMASLLSVGLSLRISADGGRTMVSIITVPQRKPLSQHF